MLEIKTVTVLGANGTMGRNVSAIFASFGNAKVYMVCRSLQDAKQAKKLAATSVRAEVIEKNMIPKTYDDLAICIAESDLVFESVAEDMQIKKKVYKSIIPFLTPKTIVGTGTSGLSINELSLSFPSDIRTNYLGIHMFNPPYNMTLCEVIPSKSTDIILLKSTVDYLKNTLFRSVAVIGDYPAFMGNRIGFQFINEAIQMADKYKECGGIDYIDSILGKFTGRSMSPILTADFVGLDVHKAIVDNIYENTNDYAHGTFKLPRFVQELIDENRLGKKTGEGFYRSKFVDGKKMIEVYDIVTERYRPLKRYNFDFVTTMCQSFYNGDYQKAITCLLEDESKEAEICRLFLVKYVIYGLNMSAFAGEDIHAADTVMATGFNWIPPLALVQAINLSGDFNKLVRKCVAQGEITLDNVDLLIENLPESKFDYRPFFKAK